MAQEGRFTANFSLAERRALDTLAREEGVTLNYIVRVTVREMLGKERLRKAREEIITEMVDAEVTSVTGNNR